MTTQYESHGNWIVGLKRLVDLTEKASDQQKREIIAYQFQKHADRSYNKCGW